MSARANPARPGTDSVPPPLRYRAFLSYSHADTKWAMWLMRRLEGFRVPARFHGRAAPIGEVGARIAPVFRDRDELPTAGDLGEVVRAALADSATLIVICSPAAAQSRWVREEIIAFKRLHGEARVFAFIISGEPKAEGTAEDCFSPALRHGLGADGQLSATVAEHVAADARPQGDGKEDAVLRLVAGLLGVGFDDLRQRELQRRHRRMTWIAVGATAGMALMLGLAAVAWIMRSDAQRRQDNSEELMAAVLNDMTVRLEKADKLDTLEEAVARMTAYFKKIDPRDLTDVTLTQQAKANTQIGQIRVSQMRYPEAEVAFSEAFKRLAALVERHPEDGTMLFERAQAEFWIGNVRYKQGYFVPAAEWLGKYRDTAVALSALNPNHLPWQREAVSSHHNLAVLDLERGDLAAARGGFLGERLLLETMVARSPDELSLQFSLANADSYLASTAERSGDYGEANQRFARQIALLESLITSDPKNTRWRRRLGDAIALQSDLLFISGRRTEALAARKQATHVFTTLAAQDPVNRDLQSASVNARIKEAFLLRASGGELEATAIVRECRPFLEKLAASAATDRVVTATLAAAWRLEAQLRDAAAEPGAVDAAARAIAIGQSLVEQDRAGDNHRGELAYACVTAGIIAQRGGDSVEARRHWQAALDAVQDRGMASRQWRLLDPGARALSLLGRTAEAHEILVRLKEIGYQPFEPWPADPAPDVLPVTPKT